MQNTIISGQLVYTVEEVFQRLNDDKLTGKAITKSGSKYWDHFLSIYDNQYEKEVLGFALCKKCNTPIKFKYIDNNKKVINIGTNNLRIHFEKCHKAIITPTTRYIKQKKILPLHN